MSYYNIYDKNIEFNYKKGKYIYIYFHFYIKDIEDIEKILIKLLKFDKKIEFHIFMHNLDLEKIPKTIFELVNIKELDLYNNKLTHIPQQIYKLSNLEELSIGKNLFETFPKEIFSLKNLKQLYTETHPYPCKVDIIGNKKELKEAKIPFQICDFQYLTFNTL